MSSRAAEKSSLRAPSTPTATNNGVSVPNCRNVSSISPEDFPALARHAQAHDLNFLLPGPEAPLVAGITDYFHEHAPSVHVFGPAQKAAQMEGSKTFAKDFMDRHHIPTARYSNFTSYDAALRHLDEIDYEVVIKADGLAAGKGVIIPTTKDEAKAALKSIMQDREFGSAGNSVVIEEFLTGHEISILSLSDGETILSLPPAQDHKRIGDGDTGPNTGGMGTYAPTPLVSRDELAEIDRTVLRPTIQGMHKEGMPFIGCLFTGFMLTPSGPRVLEYNVRFGDPETQSCLPLLQTDFAELLYACTTGTLSSYSSSLSISPLSACTVVLAAAGYPGSYAKGTPMTVAEPEEEGVYVFHAGTAVKDGQLVTAGGRVIAVTATGQDLRGAVDKAYRGVDGGLVEFEGRQFRRDIAARALR